MRLHGKRAVNDPGDAYEQEADRIADRVMRMTAQQAGCVFSGSGSFITNGDDADDGVRLQIRRFRGAGAGEIVVPPVFGELTSHPGTSLDAATRSFAQTRLGYDFSDVRIHAGSRADQAARFVDAQAFTIGRDVYFRSEKYQPFTGEGRKLLIHELVHVLQQNGARPRAGGARAAEPHRPFSVHEPVDHRQQAVGVELAPPVGTALHPNGAAVLQRRVAVCWHWRQVDNATVQRLINDAMARTGGNVHGAFGYICRLRNRDENCCDFNYAAADHYLFLRHMVGSGEWSYSYAALTVVIGGLLRAMGSFLTPLIGPRTGNCPASPHNKDVIDWEWKGMDDGDRDYRARRRAGP